MHYTVAGLTTRKKKKKNECFGQKEKLFYFDTYPILKKVGYVLLYSMLTAMGSMVHATDYGHNIISVSHWNQWSCIFREWMDGWMDRAVKSVCKTWFKKQKRVLRLDFFLRLQGGWVLSLIFVELKDSKRLSEASTTDTLTHIQAQLHQMAFISMLILIDLSKRRRYTQMGSFVRCQKKGFGEIKEKWEKVIISQWEVWWAVLVPWCSPQCGTSRLDLYISEITQMSFLTKRIVKSRSVLHMQTHAHTKQLTNWLTDYWPHKS